MASILIKDTTREQREQIVRESLGDEYDVGCGDLIRNELIVYRNNVYFHEQ